MVEITYQMVLSTLQTIALIVGITYYLIIMRNSQRAQQHQSETRQAQLFMNIYNQSFTNPHFIDSIQRVLSLKWESFDEYLALTDYANPETRVNGLAMGTLTGLFEGVGVLVKEGLLDIRMVALLMTGPVKHYWEKIEPIVEDFREYSNYPRFVSETEYLYKELKKYIAEHPDIEV